MYSSKKANRGIDIPGVEVQLNNSIFTVKKGNIVKTMAAHPDTNLNIKENKCFVTNSSTAVFAGTDFSNLQNLVKGMIQPYREEISVKGSGFKIEIQPTKIVLNVGLSHPIEVNIPEGITVAQDTTKKSSTKENIIYLTLTSTDKNTVSAFASYLTRCRDYNPYKGTGIRRKGDYVITKKSSKGK